MRLALFLIPRLRRDAGESNSEGCSDRDDLYVAIRSLYIVGGGAMQQHRTPEQHDGHLFRK